MKKELGEKCRGVLEKWGICRPASSFSLPDYHYPHWSRPEQLLAIIEAFLVVVLLAMFFYKSLFAAIPLSIVGIFFYQECCKRRVKKDLETLEQQFKECILSVAIAMKAGYAVENAFRESENDMKRLYGEKSMIYHELEIIRRGLVINITLEDLLQNMAERSGSAYILQFAQVFIIAKRSGGNLAEIIRGSAEMIGAQIDMRLEMRTVLSGRAMEQNVMKCMPFAILFYIGITSPGYFDSLYGNAMGIAVMTGCMGLYLAAYYLGNRVMFKLEQQM